MPIYDKEKYESYIHSVMDKPRQTKSKPDAPSPIMTPNNMAYYGSGMNQNQKSSNSKTKPDMSINFDGNFLTVRKDKGNAILRNTYPAVSGRMGDDGKFNNSSARQKMKGVGPIPEGQYWINPQNINRVDDTSLINRGYGVVGRGLFPGGKSSWGEGRVDIFPQEVNVNGVKRGGFTIHGGKDPGSAGCIDLMNNDGDFFKFVEKYRGNQDSIPLTVKYK